MLCIKVSHMLKYMPGKPCSANMIHVFSYFTEQISKNPATISTLSFNILKFNALHYIVNLFHASDIPSFRKIIIYKTLNLSIDNKKQLLNSFHKELLWRLNPQAGKMWSVWPLLKNIISRQFIMIALGILMTRSVVKNK